METKQANEVSGILASLSDADRAKIEAAMKKAVAKRKTIEDIKAGKNGHLVIDGTLRFSDEARKQEVSIRCSIPGCTETRTVFTSDLHQISVCSSHRKEQRKAARTARANEQRRLIAAGKAAQIKA